MALQLRRGHTSSFTKIVTTSFAVLALIAQPFYGVVSNQSASAASYGDVVVRSANPQGWSNTDTTAGGAQSFVGDAGAPYGSGALNMTTSAATTAKSRYSKSANFAKLSDVKAGLAYSTKQISASFGAGLPAFQLEMYLSGFPSGYTTLTYEPYVSEGNAAVQNNVWQSWNVSAGKFYSSKAVGSLQASQGSSKYTLDQILSEFPNAQVYKVGVNVGSNNPSYNVLVDGLKFSGTVYDFEPAAPPATPGNLRLNGDKPCGYITNVNSITPTWDAVPGAVSYNYKVVLPNGSVYGPVNKGNVTSFTGSFGSEGLSTFSVQAVDANGGVSAWATPCAVTYDKTAPSIPVNGQPRDGAYKTTNDFYFTWDPSTGASTYEFQSSGSSAVDNGSLVGAWNSIAKGNSEQNNLTTPQIHSTGASDGHYYWQVRAIDNAGNKSAWSTVWDMRIDRVAPEATFIFPTPGPTAKSFSVTFSEAVKVTDAENPANYRLNNWPGASSFASLAGHAAVAYNVSTHVATVTFTDSAWYVSAEQQWGVQNIHDMAGNLISPDPTVAYSSSMAAPLAPGTPTATSPSLTKNVVWSWSAATDPNGADASGVKGYYYYLTRGSATAIDTTFTTDLTATTTVSTDGDYVFHVYAVDNAGNQGPESTGSVTVDTNSPAVESITYEPAGWTNGDVLVTIKVNEAIDTPTGWDKVSDTEYKKIFTSNGSETVVLQDKAGNSPSTASIVVDQIDKIAPTFNIANGSVFTSSSVSVVVTESNIATINVDGIVYAGTNSVVVTGEGAHTVTATDKAGNSTTVNFLIDSVKPIVKIANAAIKTDGSYTITGTSDESSNVLVRVDGGAPIVVGVTDGEWTFDTAVLASGNHSINASTTDAAGNVGDAAQFNFEAPGPQAFTDPRVPLGGQAVLGDEDVAANDTADGTGSDTAGQDVKGTSDVKSDTTPSPFGLAWYWWLAILAAIIALWLLIAAALRRRNEEN